MEQLQNNEKLPVNAPLRLTTSSSYKVINDLNKRPEAKRKDITEMITYAKNFAKQLNNSLTQNTNYRVHVKQDDKLVCIVSKTTIEWQPGTELIQKQYKPNGKVAQQINALFEPKKIEIKDDELQNEMIDLFNGVDFNL